MPAKSLKEAGPCRNKPKNELTLSPEEQARQDADMKLLKLVEEGNVAEVKTMVNDQKQAVNVGDENGESSVHKCMRIRSPEAATQMLTMLIEAGAFADYADSYGKRPISVCMEQGESEASGLLMDALLGLVDSSGGRVVDLAATNHKTGNTHIHDACWVGNLAAIRALLATGAFNGALEATNKQGQTAMHVAAFRSPKEVVQALNEAGANVNAIEKSSRRISKETPEDMAMAMGREDTANYLKDLRTAADAVRFAAKMKMKGKAAKEAAA